MFKPLNKLTLKNLETPVRNTKRKQWSLNSLEDAANAASDGEKIIEKYAGKSSPVNVSKTLDKYEKILNRYQADLGQLGQKYGELPAYQVLSDKLDSTQQKVTNF